MKKVKPPAKKKAIQIKTQYLDSIYGGHFPEVVPALAKKLKSLRKKLPFDALAITGTSGMGMGFIMSYLLKIPVINVRKKSPSHYRSPIEGAINAKRYLILDDFMETGATVDKIRKTIRQELKGKSKAVGIFLYDSYRIAKYKGLPVYTLRT